MKYSHICKISYICQRSDELWPIEDLTFANGLLLFWLSSLSHELRPNYRGLMGQELVLIWLYLSQFVIPLTDFADLEVFHDALSGYENKFEKF